MKTEHRNNLLKLATYVEDNITDHQFDMSSYWSECGATGCLLGHSINAGLMDDIPISTNTTSVGRASPEWNRFAYDYDEISKKLFGDLQKDDHFTWEFLFSCGWWGVSEEGSSDRLDAIKRLRMFAADPKMCDEGFIDDDYIALFKDRLPFWDNEKFVFADKEKQDEY